MDQGQERLSWLNHQGPLTDEQTFGNYRPTTRTNSFETKQSAGTLQNSSSISVNGKKKKKKGKKKKLQVKLVNYRPWYWPSQSAISLPWPLKCHGVHSSNWVEAIWEGSFPFSGYSPYLLMKVRCSTANQTLNFLIKSQLSSGNDLIRHQSTTVATKLKQ